MPNKKILLKQAIEKYNRTILRVAHYETNIENIIRDKAALLFPMEDNILKESEVIHAVEKITKAKQAFEFNHLGNNHLEFPAVEYIARSFLRRVLEKTAIAQANDPSFTVTRNSQDAGIGFLDG